MNRGVFLDRDGVINKVILKKGKAYSPRFLREFEFVENIQEEIKRIKKAGYMVIIVSNQPDIARGKMEAGELEKMNEAIRAHLPIDDMFICPHDDHDHCYCRKPHPGMILQASKRYHIDLKKSFLVGDRQKVMEAAKKAGCESLLIDTLYNKEVQDFQRVRNFHEAVNIILNKKEKF